MAIACDCRKCGHRSTWRDGAAGGEYQCPKCKAPMVVPAFTADPPPGPRPSPAVLPVTEDDDDRPAELPPIARVVITGVDMPMGAMAVLLIKWAIASIPAALMVGLVALLARRLLG